jgi:hypothetical protein
MSSDITMPTWLDDNRKQLLFGSGIGAGLRCFVHGWLGTNGSVRFVTCELTVQIASDDQAIVRVDPPVDIGNDNPRPSFLVSRSVAEELFTRMIEFHAK